MATVTNKYVTVDEVCKL